MHRSGDILPSSSYGHLTLSDVVSHFILEILNEIQSVAIVLLQEAKNDGVIPRMDVHCVDLRG
jgi:hypothetical protein